MRLAPYWQDGGSALYCGDALAILPQIDPGCVDLTLTDPPYNAGKDYGPLCDDRRPYEEYRDWCYAWWVAVRRICARTIVFPGHGNLPLWFEIAKPSAIGCWYKPGNGASSLIGFEEWEPWLYWTGNKGVLGGSSVVRAVLGHQAGIEGHPCPKPLELMKRLLVKCKSQAVLDPFVGSGTTLVAARALGIRAIGIEINPSYCEITTRRLRQASMFVPADFDAVTEGPCLAS